MQVLLRLFVAPLAALVVLASCSSGDASTADAASVEAADAPTTEAPDQAAPEIEAERIVVSDQLLLDAALALDLPVVGIPGFSDRETIPPHLQDRADGVEVLGDREQVNLELLAATQPDLLLFLEKSVEASGAQEELERIAPLVSLPLDTSTPFRETLRQVARATGTEDRAEAAIAEYEGVLSDARERLGPDRLATQVSVVRCFGDSCRYLPGGSSFSGQILDELGVARPEVQASDAEGRAFVEVSPERVDLLDGDVIVLFGTDAEASIAALRANPLWERLGAVQAGAVYEVSPDPWFIGNVLAAQVVVEELTELLLQR